MFVFWLICVYFQTSGKISMESDWGKSVNMTISSTPFGELFTLDSRQRKHTKTELLRLCLFKQTIFSIESCLKTRQQSRQERRKTSWCESVT